MPPILEIAFRLLQDDSQAYHILGTGNKKQFLDHIRCITCAGVKGLDLLPDDCIFRGITARCAGPNSPDALKTAAASYKKSARVPRTIKSQFVSDARLNLHPSLRDAFLEKIPTHIVTALPTPYPPLKHHISESPEIRRKWHEHLATGYQPDQRKARHPIMDLNPGDLTRDVGPDESACFRTKSGELVGLVIRNFCTSKAAVAYADAAAAAQLPDRRNIRVSFFSFMVHLQ